MTVNLFNNITLFISEDDWLFMCNNRFFTNNPTIEDVQREFIIGTGITPNKKHLWAEANKRFNEYISELKDIQKLDINAMARNLLSNEEKYL